MINKNNVINAANNFEMGFNSGMRTAGKFIIGYSILVFGVQIVYASVGMMTGKQVTYNVNCPITSFKIKDKS